jgi:putative phosphotransacetylase
LATLFGKGATLTPKKDLSQPGQFACAERIDVVGPKRTLSGVSILGPCRKADQVEIKEGVIAAKRHIHTTPEDATTMGVADKEIVSLKVETADRTTIFGDVVVRVSPSFATYAHFDTDEANAAGMSGVVFGEIIKG